MPKISVKIENPPAGCRGEASLDHAKRYVRKGRAVFVNSSMIRFVETPLQTAIVKAAEARLHLRVTGTTGYDRTNRTFFDEARQIPIINADKMIREVRSARKWSFVTAVLHRSCQNQNNNAEYVKPPAPSGPAQPCADGFRARLV